MAEYATRTIIAHPKPEHIEMAIADVKHKLLKEIESHIFSGETLALRCNIEKFVDYVPKEAPWLPPETVIEGRMEIFPVNVNPDKVRMCTVEPFPQSGFTRSGLQDVIRTFVKALET